MPRSPRATRSRRAWAGTSVLDSVGSMERARYDALLRQGLALLASELPVPEQAQDTP